MVFLGTSWQNVSSTVVRDIGTCNGVCGRVVSTAKPGDVRQGCSRGWRSVGDVELSIANGVFERLSNVSGSEAFSFGADSLSSHVGEDSRLLGSKARASAQAHGLVRRTLGAAAQLAKHGFMEVRLCSFCCGGEHGQAVFRFVYRGWSATWLFRGHTRG